MGLLLPADTVLGHIDGETVDHFNRDARLEPVLILLVLLGVVEGQKHRDDGFSFALSLCVNRRAIERSEEFNLLVALVLSDVATSHD